MENRLTEQRMMTLRITYNKFYENENKLKQILNRIEISKRQTTQKDENMSKILSVI